MKKRNVAVLAILSIVIFFAAREIVTLRDEQHSLSFMGWNLSIQGPYISRNAFNTGTRNSDTEFFANDFDVSFQRIPGVEIEKSAGAYFAENGDIRVIEQADTAILQGLFSAEYLNQNFEEIESLNGGIKQYFRLLNQEFALLGLKEGGCTFGSFVNITKKIEILRMPCLPDSGNADLNGLGGGFTFDGETLLLAIGAPEAFSVAIRALAQDPSSPYGKVIRFKRTDLVHPKRNF